METGKPSCNRMPNMGWPSLLRTLDRIIITHLIQLTLKLFGVHGRTMLLGSAAREDTSY